MTKRRTIGENPLDAVGQESSLDSLVPASRGVLKDQPGLEKPLPEVGVRLAKLEAEVRALRIDLAQLKAAVAEVQAALAQPPEPWLLRKLKDKLAGK